LYAISEAGLGPRTAAHEPSRHTAETQEEMPSAIGDREAAALLLEHRQICRHHVATSRLHDRRRFPAATQPAAIREMLARWVY
jgi:hypothetical protein